MTKEHEQMMDMVRSAMEIAESRGNYAASVRLLFDATVDVMQLEVNGKVYTLRAGEEKALRAAQREIGRAREDVEEEAAEMEARQDETEGYGIYTPPAQTPEKPDEPAGDDIEALRAELEASKAEAQALRNSLASVTAERDTALQQAREAGEKAEAATERAEHAEAKIKAAQAALEV